MNVSQIRTLSIKREKVLRCDRISFVLVDVSLMFVYFSFYFYIEARRAGSDGNLSASGSAGPGFDPRRDSKFSFENVQPRG